MARKSTSYSKTTFTKQTSVGKSNKKTQQTKIISAEVMDIILDANHPQWNPQQGLMQGSIKARPLTRFNARPDTLEWYQPLFPNFSTGYPLLRENVLLVSAANKGAQSQKSSTEFYYIAPINIWQDTNNNQLAASSYQIDVANSAMNPPICDPAGVYPTAAEGDVKTEEEQVFPLGEYFIDEVIPKLFPYEGDVILEGRFGQSIRFGSTVSWADTPNNWSKSGENGDPIAILSNGHRPPPGADYHLEDINYDDAVIFFCDGQSIPIILASTLWDSYETSFENAKQVQLDFDFTNDKELIKHEKKKTKEDRPPETKEENKDTSTEELNEQKTEELLADDAQPEKNGQLITYRGKAIEKHGNSKIIADCVQLLVSLGATPAGGAGILGNLIHEGMGPLAKSGNPLSACSNLELYVSPSPGTDGVVGTPKNAYHDAVPPLPDGWVGVGAYEKHHIIVKTRNGKRKEYHYYKGDYSNWSGGVGLAQWTGSRRKDFEQTLIGNLRFWDGGGGPPHGSIPAEKYNRNQYNRALRNALYKGHTGILAQVRYLWDEMGNSSTYRISQKTAIASNDVFEVAWKVVANFEVPSSYKYGSPTNAYGNANKNYKPNKYKTRNGKKEYYKDAWPKTQKERGDSGQDALTVWEWYYKSGDKGNEVLEEPVNAATEAQTEVGNEQGFKIMENNLPNARNEKYLNINHPEEDVAGSLGEYVTQNVDSGLASSSNDGHGGTALTMYIKDIKNAIIEYNAGQRMEF